MFRFNQTATIFNFTTNITQAMPYIGFPRTLNALRCINEVVPATIDNGVAPVN